MKVMLRVDTEKDSPERLIALIEDIFLTKNNDNNCPSQSTLTNNNTPDKENKERKYYCNNPGCKKEIDKSVVAFCLHTDNKDRFKGKVYCRECQEGR